MAQESLVPVRAVKPVSVVLQVLGNHLTVKERNHAVQGWEEALAQMEEVAPAQINVLEDSQNSDYRTGVQLYLSDPDQVASLVKAISDRLQAVPHEIRLTTAIESARLQVQTAVAEEVRGILPALDTLLPTKQLFQARAETYVGRGGEFSPVEQANLELLRHRLNLSPEIAEQIKQRALGPYLDRQSKLSKYRDVLMAELERQSPVSEVTQGELRRLRQDLGLSSRDVAPIDEELLDQAEAERQKDSAAAAEETRLLDTTPWEDTRIDETADYPTEPEPPPENYLESYREEFRGAIAHTLYPSEFDQGRLEQARRIWSLRPEETEALEQQLTDEYYGPIASSHNLDYSRLRQLLWLHQWEAADQETERLMLSAFEGRDMQPLDDSLILQLDGTDMRTIDGLWDRYSQGQFGFRAQYRVYAQQERRADEFLAAVGWQNSLGIGSVSLLTRRKPYRELAFDLEAPLGHLPTWRWGVDTLEGDYVVSEVIVDAFFLHLERCIPDLDAMPVETSAAEENEA